MLGRDIWPFEGAHHCQLPHFEQGLCTGSLRKLTGKYSGLADPMFKCHSLMSSLLGLIIQMDRESEASSVQLHGMLPFPLN